MYKREFPFKVRWERSWLDTQGFREFRRNTYSSLSVALFVFLAQAGFYGLEDAVKDFWVALVAFIAAFVLLPVIELVANFVRSPRRILEEENADLIERGKGQAELISQLRVRLMPKLRVAPDIYKAFSPTERTRIDATGKVLDKVPGPSSLWIQILPECINDSAVEECQGHLLSVRLWKEGSWKATEFDEPVSLGWSNYDFSPMTLNPGVPQRLNIFCIYESERRIFPQIRPVPLRGLSVFNETDTYRLDIRILGKECPPVDVCLEYRWGEKWDEPHVVIVNEANAPPILEDKLGP